MTTVILAVGGTMLGLALLAMAAWWAVCEGQPMEFPGWDDLDLADHLSSEVTDRYARVIGAREP